MTKASTNPLVGCWKAKGSLADCEPAYGFAPQNRVMPWPPRLSVLKKVFLIVVKVRPHEPGIVFPCRSLEWAEIGSISFAALVKSDMAKPRRVLIRHIQQISEKRYVNRTSFAWRLLLHKRGEDDVGNVFQRCDCTFYIFGSKQVDIDRHDIGYLLQHSS